MTSTYYRSEIDGLRAISVLLIIFFHLHILSFSGGFVGVDVFFVISGFLITNIIIEDLGDGRFSFKQFYLRRIARILPALLVVIFFSLVMAGFLFSPQALVHSSKQALAALLSVSNMFFWMESNYWAPKASGFLLLHTWSLGVEEQFYLIYPFLLFFSYRFFGRKGAFFILLILFLGGLVASIIVLRSNSGAAFYLAPLRFYEFALGGLGSFLTGVSLRSRLFVALPLLGSLAGLLLILYSALTFNFFAPFPGANALIPAVGALLVILAGGSPVAQWLLGNFIMRWVGRASYSLYLVHWPVIVIYRYCLGPSLSLADQCILLLLTFLLGSLLNKGVERRFRLASGDQQSPTGVPAKMVMWIIGLATVLIAVLASAAINGKGWPERFPERVQALVQQDMKVSARGKRLLVEAHCVPQGEVFCGERKAGAKNIMVLADSRGLDIYIALLAAYPDANIYLSYAMGCAPVLDPTMEASTHFKGCTGLNRQRLAAAEAAPAGDVVFLVMNFNAWRGDFVVDTARRLVNSGKRVYVLGQSTFLRGKKPQDIAIDQIRFSTNSDFVERYLDSKPFHLDEVYSSQFSAVGATYISNRNFFYREGYRLFTANGEDLLSYDGIHLSDPGAREFGLYLSQNYPFFEAE